MEKLQKLIDAVDELRNAAGIPPLGFTAEGLVSDPPPARVSNEIDQAIENLQPPAPTAGEPGEVKNGGTSDQPDAA